MMCKFHVPKLACAILLAALLVTTGCDKKAPEQPNKTATPAKQAPVQPLVPVAQAADWCKEHGVPESVCALCDDSLVAGFKAKGDWCSKHNRPDSQCFTCHPELKKKFATAFKEKFGKAPPAFSEENGSAGHQP